jgi:hypothetical protein
MLTEDKFDEIGAMNILLGKSSDALHMSFKLTLFPKNVVWMQTFYVGAGNTCIKIRSVSSI